MTRAGREAQSRSGQGHARDTTEGRICLKKPNERQAAVHCQKPERVVMRASNSIAELRQQIHDDLRIQHPEWIEPNGECPECDFYEARLLEELDTFKRMGSDEPIAAIHPRR